MTNNVLIIEKEEDAYLLMRSLFNNVCGGKFNFKWVREYGKVPELVRNHQFDYCVINGQMFSRRDCNLSLGDKYYSDSMLIIAISGIGKEELCVNIFESNSSEFLIRGQFSSEALNNVIRYVVRNRELQESIRAKTKDFQLSENNFLSIANNNLDGLLVLDENGTVLYSNPAAGVLYDCLPQQLVGKQLEIPITDDNISMLNLIHKDGNARIVEARITNVDWTNHKAYMVSLRDITEQERELSSLRKCSIHDELTGLLNRREANRLIRDEIECNKRYKHKSSLMMFDIDNFKEINDTYGHTAGDAVLTWFGQLITSQIRSIDKVARFGGDEFIILSPLIPKELALVPARRICTQIAKQCCSLSVYDERRVDLRITISLGITELPTYGDSVNTAINTVDRALYTAKASGGNCVCLYQSEMENKNKK